MWLSSAALVGSSVEPWMAGSRRRHEHRRRTREEAVARMAEALLVKAPTPRAAEAVARRAAAEDRQIDALTATASDICLATIGALHASSRTRHHQVRLLTTAGRSGLAQAGVRHATVRWRGVWRVSS